MVRSRLRGKPSDQLAPKADGHAEREPLAERWHALAVGDPRALAPPVDGHRPVFLKQHAGEPIGGKAGCGLCIGGEWWGHRSRRQPPVGGRRACRGRECRGRECPAWYFPVHPGQLLLEQRLLGERVLQPDHEYVRHSELRLHQRRSVLGDTEMLRGLVQGEPLLQFEFRLLGGPMLQHGHEPVRHPELRMHERRAVQHWCKVL
jgi:hypothetical protein